MILRRSWWAALGIGLLVGLVGCETTGLTERQWNAGYAALTPGLKPGDVLTRLGPPREIRPADAVHDVPEIWVYSRPERVGQTTVKTRENDIPLPHGKGVVTVPVYEDQDVIKIVEYHLDWVDQQLHGWTRIVTK